MKIAPRFSLKLKLLDFAMLSQGQFLENDGEKSEEIKSKNILRKDTQRVLFTIVINFTLCDLVQGQAPKPQQQKQMALASLVSSKAKAHDSKNYLAANILKTVFQKGE